jgi:hypothetical protein
VVVASVIWGASSPQALMAEAEGSCKQSCVPTTRNQTATVSSDSTEGPDDPTEIGAPWDAKGTMHKPTLAAADELLPSRHELSNPERSVRWLLKAARMTPPPTRSVLL